MPLPLQTDRLLLRSFREEDLPAFVAYRCDPEVARYQSWTIPYSWEQAQMFYSSVRRMTPAGPGWYQLAIELNETAEMIGDCAFCVQSGSPPSAEIGYTLAPAHQGRGYATEAVIRLLEYLFDERGVARVRANCDAENHRSARLLQRVGMRPQGQDERTWFKGTWSMERWYALCREDWEAQLGRSGRTSPRESDARGTVS